MSHLTKDRLVTGRVILRTLAAHLYDEIEEMFRKTIANDLGVGYATLLSGQEQINSLQRPGQQSISSCPSTQGFANMILA